MQRTAKLFMNNRSQAVRIPKEFQFTVAYPVKMNQGYRNCKMRLIQQNKLPKNETNSLPFEVKRHSSASAKRKIDTSAQLNRYI